MAQIEEVCAYKKLYIMIKKYKLIKEYPGSSKLGTIHWYSGLNNHSEKMGRNTFL